MLVANTRNTDIFNIIAGHQKWLKPGPKWVKKIDFCNEILLDNVFVLLFVFCKVSRESPNEGGNTEQKSYFLPWSQNRQLLTQACTCFRLLIPMLTYMEMHVGLHVLFLMQFLGCVYLL